MSTLVWYMSVLRKQFNIIVSVLVNVNSHQQNQSFIVTP